MFRAELERDRRRSRRYRPLRRRPARRPGRRPRPARPADARRPRARPGRARCLPLRTARDDGQVARGLRSLGSGPPRSTSNDSRTERSPGSHATPRGDRPPPDSRRPRVPARLPHARQATTRRQGDMAVVASRRSATPSPVEPADAAAGDAARRRPPAAGSTPAPRATARSRRDGATPTPTAATAAAGTTYRDGTVTDTGRRWPPAGATCRSRSVAGGGRSPSVTSLQMPYGDRRTPPSSADGAEPHPPRARRSRSRARPSTSSRGRRTPAWPTRSRSSRRSTGRGEGA